MQKIRLVLCGMMAVFLTSGMIMNTVGVNAQAVLSEQYDSGDEEAVYYTEDAIKISDIYNVSGVEQLTPDKDNQGIITLSTWTCESGYPAKTLKPGYRYDLMTYITYECYENVKIRFKTDRDCDIVVGLNASRSDTIYATKKVSCKANTVKTVSIGLGGGTTVHPFILNTNGFNVGLSNLQTHYFVCD